MATVPEAGEPAPRMCPVCMETFAPDELVAIAVWDHKSRALGPDRIERHTIYVHDGACLDRRPPKFRPFGFILAGDIT